MTLLKQELTHSILNCAYKVHSALRSGLYQSEYEECLHYELEEAGHNVVKQKSMLVANGSEMNHVLNSVLLRCATRRAFI